MSTAPGRPQGRPVNRDPHIALASSASAAARERLLLRFGSEAAAWWERLPAMLEQLAARWQLDILDPIGGGGTSLVLRCERDGWLAVLKLSPDRALARAEARALDSWATTGHVPGLWGHDDRHGALLLEHVPAETPLSRLGSAVGLDEIAGLLAALHDVDPGAAGETEPLEDRLDFIFSYWAGRLATEARGDVIPSSALARGHQNALSLAAEHETPRLLHGDLHPGNVLQGGPGRGLVAVDPRPCIGDPAFDAIDWVYWGADDLRGWEQRCDRLGSATSTDATHLSRWCAALAPVIAASRLVRSDADADLETLLVFARTEGRYSGRL
jgi:streptomycin 6-kinase